MRDIFNGRVAHVTMAVLASLLVSGCCGDCKPPGPPDVGNSAKPMNLTTVTDQATLQAAVAASIGPVANLNFPALVDGLIRNPALTTAPGSAVCPKEELNYGTSGGFYPSTLQYVKSWVDAGGVSPCTDASGYVVSGGQSISMTGLGGVLITTGPTVETVTLSRRGDEDRFDSGITAGGKDTRKVTRDESGDYQATYVTGVPDKGGLNALSWGYTRQAASGGILVDVATFTRSFSIDWLTDASPVAVREGGTIYSTDEVYGFRTVTLRNLAFNRTACPAGHPTGGTIAIGNGTEVVTLAFRSTDQLCGRANVTWADGTTTDNVVIWP